MKVDNINSRSTVSSDLHIQQSQEATELIIRKLEADQTELVRQNTELREAKHEVMTELGKYTDLYESAPIGYFTLDSDGLINAVNLAGANLLRIERSLLIGRSFEQFIMEEFRLSFTNFLKSVFSGQHDESCELIILDNVSLPITVEIGASVTVSGQECRIALIDITGQGQAALLDECAVPVAEKQRENSNNIINLLNIVPGKMELELCVFSLREALDATLLLLKGKAHREGIKFNMDLAPEVDIRIVADQTKLKQIIFGLVSNAVKFTPEGGSVKVSAIRDGDFIEITVADTGMGIKSEDTLNLFRTFTKFEYGDTKENKGTGLNLALTRQLVELLGGRIWVESQCGEGSRFSFTMPFRDCMGIT